MWRQAQPSWRLTEVEIGWWIVRDEWGRGYASEAAKAIAQEGFERVNLPRIVARLQPSNEGSARVAEKIGMSFERETTGRHGEALHAYRLADSRSGSPGALELPRPDLTDGAIVLRAWDTPDATDLVAAVLEPDPGNAVLPRWGSAEEARDWIARQRTRLTERVGYPFAIVSCETGAVQGFVGLWLRADGSAALGYWVLPHARRRGLATRAVELVARWAHDELGITVLEIAAEPGNSGSIRVAERSDGSFAGPMTRRHR